MLRFRIDEIHVDAAEVLAGRFTRLVTRLLPSGWRFHISPVPHMELRTICGNLAPSSCETIGHAIEGTGALEHWDQPGTLHGEAWQEEFRECMVGLVQPGQISTFWLVDRREDVWFDDYHTRRMDVDDFERTAPRDAAAALLHAWQEDLGTGDIRPADMVGHTPTTRPLPIDPDRFALDHMLVQHMGEAQVMGGVRQEARCRSRPPGVAPHNARPGQRYEYWVPYELRGGAVRAVIMRLEGGTVLGSRIADFGSFTAFDEAASMR